MTLLCYEEKRREILRTLVTWAISVCALSVAVSKKIVTWPSNRQRPASWSVVLVRSRARPRLPWMIYLVPGCVSSGGICCRAREVMNNIKGCVSCKARLPKLKKKKENKKHNITKMNVFHPDPHTVYINTRLKVGMRV